ncbi:sulfite oxidase-like oxidoreductase [Caldisphaera lagunensis DSM 15908]|uniref:Sulfite oxidase-like oxidoreductase n=1 Tax=Caldisphaera lagunensis (strain DSM 15908 / JCM 11604 / ANMR 0165 / IC-154) TaxID=1056495 RepID=L0ACV7_CALLD|nr:molybdopterin-dependent oxidoreductase [Caldisphaera lagunensis]AFZ70977.1 sulfite oxidase-like oxidoreductase [Caldisphaera lagunensis DSM 15908]
MEIQGCKAYYNKELEALDIPIVFECGGSIKIKGFNDIKNVALNTIKTLNELFDYSFELGDYIERELIGRSFNLHKFKINALDGILRIVEKNGYFLNSSGVIFSSVLNKFNENIAGNLIKGKTLEFGEKLEPIFLDKSCSSEIPVGQKEIPKFVIYIAENYIPSIDINNYKLSIKGNVPKEIELSYNELEEISKDIGEKDFHCVTGWSVKGRKWKGISVWELLKLSGIKSESKWILAKSLTGYSSTIPMDKELLENTFVVIEMDNKKLSPESGFPARIYSPELFGWKGAKYLSSLYISDKYIDGYWEALSYHERGKANSNERFKIRNPDVVDLC